MSNSPHTHAANSSDHYIWVKVDADRYVIESVNAKLAAIAEKGKLEVGVKIRLIPSSIQQGFTRIAPNGLQKFQVGTWGTAVYCAVYYEDGDLLKPMTTGFKIQANESIIAKKNCTVCRSKHNKVWEPEFGD